MMRRIIEHPHGHSLKNHNIYLLNEYRSAYCSQDKLIVRPSLSKVTFESLVFLVRLHGDVCGPIHLSRGPFNYFMV